MIIGEIVEAEPHKVGRHRARNPGQLTAAPTTPALHLMEAVRIRPSQQRRRMDHDGGNAPRRLIQRRRGVRTPCGLHEARRRAARQRRWRRFFSYSTTLLPFASALGEGGSEASDEASESLKERQPPGLRPERGGDREPKKGSEFELMPCDMEGRPETAGDWEPRNDSAFGFRPGDAKRRARRTANYSVTCWCMMQW